MVFMTDKQIVDTALKPYKHSIVNGTLVLTVRSLRKMIYRACEQAVTQEIVNEAKYIEAMRSNHD